MPKLVEYPIDDTVEYILANSSTDKDVPEGVRDALTILVTCCVRPKTFKVSDMVKLLPGGMRDDTVIETLKLKQDSIDKLNGISPENATAAIAVINGYKSRIKNVHVIANNIRSGKLIVDTTGSSDDGKPASVESKNDDEHDGTADSPTDSTDDEEQDRKLAEPEYHQDSDDDAVGVNDGDDDEQGDGESNEKDAPDDVPSPDQHNTDFAAILKDDSSKDLFTTEFDDTDDEEDSEDEQEFGDDDGDDVNGYVDEDAPIDIDTDEYRRRKAIVDSPQEKTEGESEEIPQDSTDNQTDDTESDDGSDEQKLAEPVQVMPERIENDNQSSTDDEDGDSTPDDDNEDEAGDEPVEETNSVESDDTDTPNADSETAVDVDANAIPDTAADAATATSSDTPDEPKNDEEGGKSDSDESSDVDNEEQNSVNASEEDTAGKPNLNQIPVAREVQELHDRIVGIDDPAQVQEEFEKLSPEAKIALADFASEKAKEAKEKEEAPDTTGGLPEFARELEAEKKAAAASASSVTDEDDINDDISAAKDALESDIGNPDIINTIADDLDEPDSVNGDADIDYSERNPMVSGMLDKMYDGHGLNGKSACVMLCPVIIALTMIPFTDILNINLRGFDSFAFISDPLFAVKMLGVLVLLFIIARFASLTAQSKAFRKNEESLSGKAERTAYRLYEPGVRAEFMFPSRTLGETARRTLIATVEGLALSAALSVCVVDAPIASMGIMAIAIVSMLVLGSHPLVNPESGVERHDLSESAERYVEGNLRSNKRKDCWMLTVLFMSFMTCVSLGQSIGLTCDPIEMFLTPTLSASIPWFTAFGIAGVLAIAHAFMVTIGLNKKPLSLLWTLVKSALLLAIGLGIGVLFTICAATSMAGLVLIAIIAVCFYLAATSSDYKADLPLKRH